MLSWWHHSSSTNVRLTFQLRRDLGKSSISRIESSSATPATPFSNLMENQKTLYSETEQKGSESLSGIAELPWGSADHTLVTAARVGSPGMALRQDNHRFRRKQRHAESIRKFKKAVRILYKRHGMKNGLTPINTDSLSSCAKEVGTIIRLQIKAEFPSTMLSPINIAE